MRQEEASTNPFRRGRRAVALGGVTILAATFVAGCGSSHKARSAPTSATSAVPVSPPSPSTSAAAPPTCPLSGMPPAGGRVPQRPALGVKIDNLNLARPQSGLSKADVIYEEPVEGGITRFIAIFQCNDAARIGPVRSGRLIDPQILMQYGSHPLLGYSGAIGAAITAIDSSSLIDVGINRAPASAYSRDPNRAVPHNLYTSTRALYAAAAAQHAPAKAPPSPFVFGPEGQGATPSASVHIPYLYSDVTWTWNPKAGVWFRSYADTGAATGADGGPVVANDVIVMHVVMYPSRYIEDATGAHENLLTLTGTGPLQVYRNGTQLSGTWKRPALSDATQYLDSSGHPIALQPGRIWIELVPTTVPSSSTP